jgi:hypothetical protein
MEKTTSTAANKPGWIRMMTLAGCLDYRLLGVGSLFLRNKPKHFARDVTRVFATLQVTAAAAVGVQRRVDPSEFGADLVNSAGTNPQTSPSMRRWRSRPNDLSG